MAEPF